MSAREKGRGRSVSLLCLPPKLRSSRGCAPQLGFLWNTTFSIKIQRPALVYDVFSLLLYEIPPMPTSSATEQGPGPQHRPPTASLLLPELFTKPSVIASSARLTTTTAAQDPSGG